MSRPPLPPPRKTAVQKARIAEDAWNSRDPERVALAYTEDSRRRNRSEFLEGRPANVAFLTRKWQRELGYRLAKDLWAFARNFIAVRKRGSRSMPGMSRKPVGVPAKYFDQIDVPERFQP